MTKQRTQATKAHHHLAAAVKLSPAQVRRDMAAVRGFNAKFAVLITSAVGTMACAYGFTVLALVSLPAILVEAGAVPRHDVPTLLTKPGLILVVAWVAQTFIQLVLLSIIMVGQDVQSKAADSRSEHTFEDTERILDLLDARTEGGIKTVLDAIAAHAAVTKPRRRSNP